MNLFIAKLGLQNSLAAPPYKMNQKMCLENRACKFVKTRMPVRWHLIACEVNPVLAKYGAVKETRLEKYRLLS